MVVDVILAPAARPGNVLTLLLERNSDFCLNHPRVARSHRENIQRHRISDNSSLPSGMHVFRSSSLGTLDRTVN